MNLYHMLEFMSPMDQEAKLLTWVIKKNKKWIKMKIEKILRLCEKQMNDMGCHFLCVPSYSSKKKKSKWVSLKSSKPRQTKPMMMYTWRDFTRACEDTQSEDIYLFIYVYHVFVYMHLRF